MWKALLAIWGSTAMAIGIALYYTHDIRCLWFLLIPACMSYRSNDEADSEDCRDCKKFDDCPCGKDGHESGTSQGYSIGECKDFEPQESEKE